MLDYFIFLFHNICVKAFCMACRYIKGFYTFFVLKGVLCPFFISLNRCKKRRRFYFYMEPIQHIV